MFIHNMTGLFRTALDRGKSQIINSTEAEDVFYKNHKRPFHWHFYMPEQDGLSESFRKLCKFTLFSHVALSRHEKRFKVALGKLSKLERDTVKEQIKFYKEHDKLYEAIGGILHHVQDMSTPSHVVPVFHGKPAPGDFKPANDQFEIFADENIADHISSRNNWLMNLDEDMNISEKESFISIYKQAARDTKEFLESAKFKVTIEQQGEKEVGCELFWKEYDFVSDLRAGNETAGFGSYGPMEHLFGKKSADQLIAGKNWNIQFENYKHIYFHQLAEMIKNSYKTLQLAGHKYSQVIGQ